MTVCGFSIADANRAIAWADSEIFNGGEPSGEYAKMSACPLSSTFGVGTGTVGMLMEAGAILQSAPSLEDALRQLHGALAAIQHTPASPAARGPTSMAAYAVIGWSAELGRVAGFVLRASSGFEPCLARTWCAPRLEIGAADVVDFDGAAMFAQQQIRVLQQEMPRATGGLLTIGELHDGGITLRPPIDLQTGARPSRRAKDDLPMVALPSAANAAGPVGSCPAPGRLADTLACSR